MMRSLVFIIVLVVGLPCHAISPAPVGEAVGEYDPSTGVIHISASAIKTWHIYSTGANLTGDPAANLPAWPSYGYWDNDWQIGDWANVTGNSGSTGIVNLGPVAATYLPADDLTIHWMAFYNHILMTEIANMDYDCKTPSNE